MNFKQVENRNKSIIENAIEWANNRECDPLYQTDIYILSGYLNMNLPKSFNNFVYTEKRNQVKLYGAEKTIFKTLDKIADKIISLGDNLIELV